LWVPALYQSTRGYESTSIIQSAEGLRLVLCFAFNYGIRVYTHNPASAFCVQSGRQECYTRSDDGRGIRAKTFACDRMEDTTRHLFRDLCLRCGALDQS